MITACHSCEFNGKGLQLEALIPNGTTDRAALEAKEALARFFAARCVNCKRCSQDDIRIEKTPKNECPELTVDRNGDNAPSAPCTDLPEAVEDTLRRLLITITGLDPLDAMLLFYVARGGTPGTFGRFLNKTFDEARLYGPSIGRATAKAKWTAICKKFAPFSALRSWGVGHGGREAGEDGDIDDENEPKYTQGDLFS